MSDDLRLATAVKQEFLELLGAISTNFSSLEFTLSRSIWWLLGSATLEEQRRYFNVTAQLSFKQLVWMTASLYRHRFPDQNEDKLESIVKRCFRLANYLIHSLWIGQPGVDGVTLLKMTSRSRGIRTTLGAHSRREFVAVANGLADLSQEVNTFFMEEMERLLSTTPNPPDQ